MMRVAELVNSAMRRTPAEHDTSAEHDESKQVDVYSK
jgi:hypothetical protein